MAERNRWRSAPTWLLSKGELKEQPTRLQFNNLSLSILNHGHGAYACVTVRETDDESAGLPKGTKSKYDGIAEFSKGGVIGRLITGLRIKLLEV